MKPNHSLSRLRQDIRKMASANDEAAYSRYKTFATHKLKRLREQYRAQEMTQNDVDAFKDCVTVFAEVVNLHDGMA